MTIEKPRPYRVNDRGIAYYRGSDLAVYRLLNACTQVEVAAKMGIAQPLISIYEKTEAQDKWTMRIFDAIDAIAASRQMLVDEGLARQAGEEPRRVVGMTTATAKVIRTGSRRR